MSTRFLPHDLGDVATRFGFNPGLDGLRAIAVGFVLAEHGDFHAPGGYHGVEVFFVISGYLITSLLLSEFRSTGRIHFRHFYWRRLVRLGPAFVVIVLVTVAWLFATGRPLVEWWAGAVGSLTYTTDILSLFPTVPVSHYFQWSWSLGIEEHFYLLWPFIVVLLVRWGRFVPSIVILTLLALTDFLVRQWSLGHGASVNVILFGPFSHYDALLLGCILGLVLARFPSGRVLWWASNILGPIGAIILVRVIVTGHGVIQGFPDPYAFGQTAFAALAVVAWVARNPLGWFSRVMAFRPLAFLGRLSYSIYLWNIIFLWAFVDLVGLRPASSHWGVLWVVIVVGVAWLSYRFVETPLRRRWAPPRSHAVVEQRETQPTLSG